jgi:hypothetical protein
MSPGGFHNDRQDNPQLRPALPHPGETRYSGHGWHAYAPS